MKLEKLVDILGKALDSRFIVRRNFNQHSTFKGYTIHTIELYSIVDKTPKVIFTVENVVPPQMKDHAEEIMEELFLEKLFETYATRAAE